MFYPRGRTFHERSYGPLFFFLFEGSERGLPPFRFSSPLPVFSKSGHPEQTFSFPRGTLTLPGSPPPHVRVREPY